MLKRFYLRLEGKFLIPWPAKEGFSLTLLIAWRLFDQSQLGHLTVKSVSILGEYRRRRIMKIWIQDAMQTEGAKQLTKRKAWLWLHPILVSRF